MVRDAKEASDFLQANGYQISPHGDTSDPDRITYIRRTGNGAWEGTLESPGVGPQNNWVMTERGTCCPQYEKKGNPNYCGGCGNGVNGNLTWLHGYPYDGLTEDQVVIPEPINQAQRDIRAKGV